PAQPIGQRSTSLAGEIRQSPALKVVIAAVSLQVREHATRVLERPVRQHDRELSLVIVRLRLSRLDDNGPVDPGLLLKPAVAVVPVGPALADWEAILEGRGRRDAWKAHSWHSVHPRRDEETMPVDGGVLVQRVRDSECDVLSFAEADLGPWNSAIDCRG